jgi:hypothetical protein
MIDLITNSTDVPKWFQKRLTELDHGLLCYWNPLRRVFVIDRCVLSNEDTFHVHSPACPKTNVTTFPQVAESVIDDLKRMDAWSKFKDVEAFRQNTKDMESAYQEKSNREQREIHEGAAKDNKRQLQQAFDLIQRHDMRPNR